MRPLPADLEHSIEQVACIRASCKLPPLHTYKMPMCKTCIKHHLIVEGWKPGIAAKGPKLCPLLTRHLHTGTGTRNEDWS